MNLLPSEIGQSYSKPQNKSKEPLKTLERVLRVYGKSRTIYTGKSTKLSKNGDSLISEPTSLPPSLCLAQWDENHAVARCSQEHKDPSLPSSHSEGEVSISQPVPSYLLLRLIREWAKRWREGVLSSTQPALLGWRLHLGYCVTEYTASPITFVTTHKVIDLCQERQAEKT